MADRPADHHDPAMCSQGTAHLSSDGRRRLFAQLCALENLERASAQVRSDFAKLPTESFGFVVAEGSADLLRLLSLELQAGTYRPGEPFQQASAGAVFESPDVVAYRDGVVQVALRQVLGPLFPEDLPCAAEPDKAVEWLARTIGQGLTRVYAVNLEGCGDPTGQPQRLMERMRLRIGDPEVAGLVQQFLQSSRGCLSPPPGPLAPMLANLAFEGVDRTLRQARALGRQEGAAHVTAARFGNELIVLSDEDPHYAWLFPAVRQRLREELTDIGFELDPAKTQVVDLARGDELCILGFRVWSMRDRHGSAQVQYEPLAGPVSPPSTADPAAGSLVRFLENRCRRWLSLSLGAAGRLLRRTGLPRCGQLVRDAWRGARAIEIGWRHLPITMWPVLALAFGWRSPVAVLCAVAIVLCNARGILGFMRSAGVLVWQRWLDAAMAACGLAAFVCLALLVADFHANRSREVPVARLAPGFYLGQFRPPDGRGPVPYGLYLPPHFWKEAGPFPLIVFLHGYGERTPETIFSAGLPRVLNTRLGDPANRERFEFVGFFPIIRTGNWLTEVYEVHDAMRALDYVMERHRIDPTRVYLTGLSNGGSGVWRLAEDYPDKWAALAPVSAFTAPDAARVRHLPAWVFHGARDKQAPVDEARAAVRQLQKAKADVRYTEFPDKGHLISHEVYGSDDLYRWFAGKTRK
jgi:predicted esterase